MKRWLFILLLAGCSTAPKPVPQVLAKPTVQPKALTIPVLLKWDPVRPGLVYQVRYRTNLTGVSWLLTNTTETAVAITTEGPPRFFEVLSLWPGMER